MPDRTIYVDDMPGWSSASGANNTAAMQAALDLFKTTGRRIQMPPGPVWVTGVSLDYSGDAPQADSGPPYGIAGPIITGTGWGSGLYQLSGSTADVFSVRGQIGSKAGPGNNNKVTGMYISDMEIVGNSPTATATGTYGGHGFRLRSAVNCVLDRVRVRNCGKNGLYAEREMFVPDEDDEYMYALKFRDSKFTANREWGVAYSGTNAIGAVFDNCEAIGNGAGGFNISPTNTIFLGGNAIGNGVGKTTARGLYAHNATNSASVTSNLTLVGFRPEENSTPGGYEIEVDGVANFYAINTNGFPTAGASVFGIGLKSAAGASDTLSPVIVGGRFGIETPKFPGQLLARFGAGAIRGHIEQPLRIFNPGGSIALTDVIVDAGTATTKSATLTGVGSDITTSLTALRGGAGPSSAVTWGASATIPATALGSTLRVTLTGNTVLTVATPTTSDANSILLDITQDSIGNRVITWPANVTWRDSTDPVLSTLPNKTDLLVLVWTGAQWRGHKTGNAYG